MARADQSGRGAALKKLIYKCIPAGYKEFIRQEILNEHPYYRFLNICFSQEGEDQILAQYFYGVERGFFVDIGAYHPIRYSNTYKFYLNGWRGINIDAMPGSMTAFNAIRPEDVNVETGVAETDSDLLYYVFEQTGINTFSETFAADMVTKGYSISRKTTVRTRPLREILAQHVLPNQAIDFLSLDVEGFELNVLRSNDWSAYRPKVIVVESLGLKNKPLLDDFLNGVDYQLIAATVNNVYYAEKLGEFGPGK